MVGRTIIFLIVNFSALALGGLFTSKGVPSDWYGALNKAPWTPPGWVFGFAWSTIMVCFSFYMAYLWPNVESRRLLIYLYVLQFVLNVAWNPTFFYFHKTIIALVIIIALTALVGFFVYFYWAELKAKSILLLPYLLWLVVATSLNGYVVFNN